MSDVGPGPAGRRRSGAGLPSRVLTCLLALVIGCARGPTPAVSFVHLDAAPAVPVVLVPGVTGSHLWDAAEGRRVWGRTKQLLCPRDGGYRLALPLAGLGDGTHPQALYEPAGPLLQLRVLGWTKPIYRPVLERLEREGYRHGDLRQPGVADTLFVFDYDWRRSSPQHARKLDALLAGVAAARGAAEVDLVCQSNAAKICRYLVKHRGGDGASAEAAQPTYRVRKVVLAGVSGNGALRALRILDRGRRYLPAGRRMSEEVMFTLRPLFEELPLSDGAPLFFDPSGEGLAIDLHDASEWVRLGLSVFDPTVAERLERRGRSDLFGTSGDRLRYLEVELAAARSLHDELQADVPGFSAVRYYRLENGSRPTAARALLLRRSSGWRVAFPGDPEVDGDPALRALATVPGDGHATLASQRLLSPQEEAVVAGVEQVDGGHFEMLVEPAGLDALVRALAD